MQEADYLNHDIYNNSTDAFGSKYDMRSYDSISILLFQKVIEQLYWEKYMFGINPLQDFYQSLYYMRRNL